MLPRRDLVLLLGGYALLRVAPGMAATLRQATLTAPANGARLVLELSAAPSKPDVFMLPDQRLVIDLPGTSLAKGFRLPAPAGLVRALREGRQADGTLRLVLELSQEIAHKVHVDGRQLIVELGQIAALPPAPAPEQSARRAEHAPADAGRDIIVAIDPGHGGPDPGALGRLGTKEKDVVLAISLALAKLIDAEPGMRSFLTRNDDRSLTRGNDRAAELRERSSRARRAQADIFISVHADASTKSDVVGSSVYVLNEKGASNEAARLLAERENAADLKGGISLGDKTRPVASVLMDLSQTRSIGNSAAAAERVLAQLNRVGTIRKTPLHNANFMVLKLPDVPSMLIETAFISNPAEEKKLRSPAHQQAIAQAIFNGVREYFRESPPDGTLYARLRDQRRLVAAQP
jgi:N-acetylmuramoyl-L-alanine amidase